MSKDNLWDFNFSCVLISECLKLPRIIMVYLEKKMGDAILYTGARVWKREGERGEERK